MYKHITTEDQFRRWAAYCDGDQYTGVIANIAFKIMHWPQACIVSMLKAA